MGGQGIRIPLLLLALFFIGACSAFLQIHASDDTVFYDSFDESFEKRWVVSGKEDYRGVWKHEKSEGHDDHGLLVSEKARKYAIVKELDKRLSLKDGTVVLQFETRLQNGLECGGAYLKYLRPQEAGWKPEDFDNESPYSIMFGPDKCGATNKVHFIFKHKNPNSGEYVEHHLKNPPTVPSDKLSHVYTAILKPDNEVKILVDGEEKKKANFLSADDFEPPLIPPKTIPDSEDKKPEDWDERAKIPDPEAVKPDDWDENAPLEIEDLEAESVQKIEPYTDYYVWKDPKGYDGEGKPIPPNNWESIFAVGRPGSAWEWNPERKQFYYHAFMVEQPDLNFRNPKVIEELKDIMKFWMDKGVQGWRLDAVPHLIEDEELRDEHGNNDKTQNLPETYKIIEDFRAFIDAYSEENYVNIFLTTEGYAGPQETVKYYGTDGRVGAHFPFNFLLLTDFNAETKALNIKNTIQSYLDRLDDFKFPNWVSGNHDWPRIPSRMGASSATDIVNIMNLLLPGTSTVFMGDELGMDSYWNLDREACPSGVGDDYRTPARTPFHWNSSKNAGFTQASKPWVPVNPEYYRTNVEVERTLRSKYQTSHLENFKSLAALKREHAFMYGELKMYDLTEYVFAFTRQDDSNIYLAIMNLGKGFSDPFVLEREIPDLAQASPRKIVMRSVNLQSECINVSSCYDSLTSGEWSMPPKSGMVLSFRKSWRPSRRNTPISGWKK